MTPPLRPDLRAALELKIAEAEASLKRAQAEGDSDGLSYHDGRADGYTSALRMVEAALSAAPQETVEQAFKAGYHCCWHKDVGVYCFDPTMSPGDPDGAFKAWLASISAPDTKE